MVSPGWMESIRRDFVSGSSVGMSRPGLVKLGFQARDLNHDLIGDLLVDFFDSGFWGSFGFLAQWRKVHDVAEFNNDSPRTREPVRAAVGEVRTKDANGNHRRVGFDDSQTDAGAGRQE